MADHVLITGATGHVGFHVLTHTLDAGYSVRAAVRSTEKFQALLDALPSRFNRANLRLTFTIVPDLTLPGAYDDAVKDVQYVIHVASPTPSPQIPFDQFEKALIEPAVRGTLGILESARKVPTIRRVVITSSIAAIIPFQALAGGADKVFSATSRIPSPDTAALVDLFQAYAASKTTAFNEVEKWMKRERPFFDVVHVHPSFVMGRDELQNSRQHLRSQGTNKYIINVAVGVENALPVASATVHVQDVARVHVGALRLTVPGNTSYVVTSNSSPGRHNGSNYNEVSKIVAKHFPDAVSAGLLPNNGRQPFNVVKFDASPTEKVFGFRHLSWEEQVKEVIEQYLGAE